MKRYKVESLEFYPDLGFGMVVKQVKRWWGWKMVSGIYFSELRHLNLTPDGIKHELDIREYEK